jgi:predicted transposase YdaD
MTYDIAAKVLIEKCRREILWRFVGIPVAESTLLEEVPQETASLRRSDFPILVTEEDGRQCLVLLEIQSRWERDFPLRLLEYRCRHKLKQDVETISCVLLLRPSAAAADHYVDNEVSYHYRLVRVYELDAAAMIEEAVICLLPFVPLMRGGVELTPTADRLLCDSSLSRTDKAEMLTTMAILAGLVSESLPQELVARRRDLMIESVTYDLIKQEGILVGLEKGRQEGLQRGIREGLLDAIALGLDLRFGALGLRLLPEIAGIQDVALLRAIAQGLRSAPSPEDVRLIYRTG